MDFEPCQRLTVRLSITGVATKSVVGTTGLQTKTACLEKHAVFLLTVERLLVFNYLSKIIYHNITPSADYDAITNAPIARTFSATKDPGYRSRSASGSRGKNGDSKISSLLSKFAFERGQESRWDDDHRVRSGKAAILATYAGERRLCRIFVKLK